MTDEELNQFIDSEYRKAIEFINKTDMEELMKPIEEMSIDDLKARIAELEARLDEREKLDNWQPVVSYRMKFKDLTDDEQVRAAKEYAREHNMSFFDAVERLANEL